MTLSYRDGIAIAQLIYFVPCAVLAAVLAFRHGFGKLAGWLFLIIFSLLRIIGAIFRLVAISHPSTSVIAGEIVCASIGLSPLALMLLALLGRVNMFMQRGLPQSVFKLLSTISLIGLILGIVGGSTAIKPTGYKSNAEIKAGIIIFTVIFVAVLVILCFQSLRLSSIDKGEKRILIAVALCAPFYLVRLVYSLMSSVAGNRHFSFLVGSPTLYLCMAVLEEFVIVIICIGFGLTLRIIPKAQSIVNAEEHSMEHQGSYPDGPNMAGKNAPQVSKSSRRRRGPISMLIGKAIDMYRSRS